MKKRLCSITALCMSFLTMLVLCTPAFAAEVTDCEHDYIVTSIVEPTCTEQGYTTYTCQLCGDTYDAEYVDSLGHDWDQGTVTTEPTYSSSGVMTYVCNRCGEEKTESIAKLPQTKISSCTATLNKTTYTYDGKAKKPGVTVKDGSKTLVDGADYTVSYTNNKKIGTATAVISGMGKYTGNLELKFTIKLGTPSISKVTCTGSGMKISWGKVSGASGYYVYRGSKKIKTTTSTSYTDTKAATNGTKYQYKIVAYTGSSKTTSGKKSAYFLTTPKISSLKSSAAKKLTVKWGKNSKASGYQVQYSTSSSFKNATTKTVSKASTVSKTISSLTGGKKYYVRVRSYKNNGSSKNYSAWSKAKSVTVKKAASSSKAQASTVYVTKTGTKFHRDGCKYLSKSKKKMTRSEAVSAGYEPCSVCKP